MGVNKFFLLGVFLVLFSAITLYSQEEQASREGEFYIGVNPLALASFFPPEIAAYATFFGRTSGWESGGALYGGYSDLKGHGYEFRFSTGPADRVFWETQAQSVYLWYPAEPTLGWKGGPTLGFALRGFSFKNTLTEDWIFNFVPEAVAGWKFGFDHWSVDTRIGWNFASLSMSTMERSHPGLRAIGFLQGLNMTIGASGSIRVP